MSDAAQFQKKLVGILSLCEENGNEIDRESVKEFFEEENLSKEQMNLVYDYLLSQKVLVKGYTKTVNVEEAEDDSEKFSYEEIEFLRQYEEDIHQRHLQPDLCPAKGSHGRGAGRRIHRHG